MQRSITLTSGEHTVSTPSFYALQLMSEYGVDFGGAFAYSDISAILAALLTDSEPLDDNGYPRVLWTPPMAAKQLTPDALEPMLAIVTELLNDAFPDAPKKEQPARPTKPQTSSAKA